MDDTFTDEREDSCRRAHAYSYSDEAISREHKRPTYQGTYLVLLHMSIASFNLICFEKSFATTKSFF
jgi:hypothetical protein